MDSLTAINNRSEQIKLAFQVEVSQINNIWIATSTKLSLVTEADNYEELVARVWAIAADLYELNGLGMSRDEIRLTFIQTPSSDQTKGT